MSQSNTTNDIRHDVSLITDDDLYYFNQGTHADLDSKLGAHTHEHDGVAGTCFAVWAPNAKSVSVVGDFNGWDRQRHRLKPRQSSGIWEGFIPGVGSGTLYKYAIDSAASNYQVSKADPYGAFFEVAPKTASIVWDLDYEWNDSDWMKSRRERNALGAPQSIYEVHLGSWMRVPEDGNRSLSYRELAPLLADHVTKLGFTHVELMPVMEHPFFGSWGYQITGFFAPSSRFGTPQDFKYLIDYLHQRGIGVILDWVPSHFPNDEHGLGYFDGSHLYEHADPRQGFHPDWNSYIFNYGRNEVRSFLLSNAMFWLKEYHADGLRVDAVASMLYLDYSRKEGEWIPNEFGGRENLNAISFMRFMNEQLYGRYDDICTIAEESTSWPMVSRPNYVGGLGFGLKWDMGWMHDTLKFMAEDPVHRKFHHGQLTFRMIYAFHENFVMPLSHDEVVHGKGSLLAKMPGDDWQKFANLRLLYGYMYGMPGKKLLFMGAEMGTRHEWTHDSQLEWDLLAGWDESLDDLPDDDSETEPSKHAALARWLRSLNRIYREEPALHQADCEPEGFEWIDANDYERSVVSFIRKGKETSDTVLVVCNFTPVPRYNYRVGVPSSGYWKEILNSDAREHGGSGHGNLGGASTTPIEYHGRKVSLNLTLPPLSVVFLKKDRA